MGKMKLQEGLKQNFLYSWYSFFSSYFREAQTITFQLDDLMYIDAECI